MRSLHLGYICGLGLFATAACGGATPDAAESSAQQALTTPSGLTIDPSVPGFDPVKFCRSLTGFHVIIGTSNNDTLTGTAGRDCIVGLGGQDTINGLAGDDIIFAGDGDDTVHGGDGNDTIFGGSGQDHLFGDAGDDVLSGDDGDDQLSGGDGNDQLFGGSGQDRLSGDNGNDRLSGDDGDDQLTGGAGADTLSDCSGHNTFDGGTGTNSCQGDSTASRFSGCGLVQACTAAQACVPAPKNGPSGVITEFPLPTRDSRPFRIVTGPDKNLWFTEFSNNKIGRITTAGVLTEFDIPTPNSAPSGITAAADGNLWFIEQFQPNVGRITPDGVMTEFPLVRGVDIASASDGSLWVTSAFADEPIFKLNLQGSLIDSFPIAAQTSAIGLAPGANGAVWFAQVSLDGNRISRMSADGVVTEFGPGGGGFLTTPIAGPDGNFWFPAGEADIDRITPDGVITTFTAPSDVIPAQALGAGPDCNVWFTGVGGTTVGRLTSAGVFTQFALPPETGFTILPAITAGPDGNVWFVEDTTDSEVPGQVPGGNAIARITP